MRILISFFFLLTQLSVFGADITIGQRRTMHSALLNEQREYWVYLPAGYNDSIAAQASYPVIYVLDGERHFYTHVAIQHALGEGLYRYMPEAIVVGVVNTDRTRDLTPSKSSLLHQGKALFGNSGGAEQFHRFLTEELRREISAQYRVNGYSALVGHSFGGLFAVYSLLNHPGSFQAYVALDPSLWWDDSLLMKQAAERWNMLSLKGVNLYLSFGGEEKGEQDRQKQGETIREFCTRFLSDCSSNGLRARWDYLENEDHGTIWFPGSFQAMKFLFDGIRLNVKQVPAQPEKVEAQFRELSEKLQFRFVPEEDLLHELADYCVSVRRETSAVALLKLAQSYYPDSEKTRLRLAELRASGETGETPDFKSTNTTNN